MSSTSKNIKKPSSGYWLAWYIVVFVVLLAEIGFFYWLTVENR